MRRIVQAVFFISIAVLFPGIDVAAQCSQHAEQFDWSNGDSKALPVRLAVLLDTRGSVSASVARYPGGMTEVARAVDSWLGGGKPGPLQRSDQFATASRFGLLASGGNWQTDYLRGLPGKGPLDSLDRYGSDFHKSSGELTDYGTPSLAPSLFLRSLAGCNIPLQQMKVVVITNNRSNHSRNRLGSNDLIDIRQKGTTANINYAYNAVRLSGKYYDTFSKQRTAIFVPGRVPDESEDGQDRARPEDLSVSVIDVQPAIPLETSHHIELAEAIRFRFVAEGYAATIRFNKQQPPPDDPYQLMGVCIQLIGANPPLEQCKRATDDLTFSLSVGESAKDRKRIEVTQIYRYAPSELDLGLTKVNTQQWGVVYMDPPRLRDGTTLSRADLRSHPGEDAEGGAKRRDAEIAADEGRRSGMIIGMIIAACFVVAWLAHRWRAKFPPPRLAVELVRSNGVLLVAGDGLGPVSGSLAVELDHPASQDGVLVGYVRFKNTAGTNGYGRGETLSLTEAKATVVSTRPTGIAGQALRLGHSVKRTKVEFSGMIEFPLLFHPGDLTGLQDSDFPGGKMVVRGSISAQARRREVAGNGNVQVPDVSFDLAVDVKPCSYEFALRLEALVNA